jgi:serine protease Do
MKTLHIHSPFWPGVFLTIGFIAGLAFFLILGVSRSAVKPSETLKPVSPMGHELLDQFSVAFENAAAKVNQSVVPIFSEQVTEVHNPFASGQNPFRNFFGDDMFNRFFGGPENQKEVVRALGSGVIVSKDGYILTNNHVVDHAQKLTVMLGDKKKYSAKLIGKDPQTDVAVIKIDKKDLPTATLGNSDQVRVGQWVIAVGNPFQLMHTVTAGIISAKGRASVNIANYGDFIQTDASINPGNSGGALADLDGNVIGINTAIYSPSGGSVGIGFAIPVDMAKRVMEELISKGKVARGYLGVVPQDIDETMAKALKLKTTEGSLIGDVTSGGPAAKAGIQPGDIIIEFNGKKIENGADLRNIAAETESGTSVDIKILRDGKEKTITVKLAERPNDEQLANAARGEPDHKMSKTLGISTQTLTPALSKQLGLHSQHGVVITEVTPGSPADDAGLKDGDLINEVDRTKVQSVLDFQKAIHKLSPGDDVAFLVKRGQRSFFVAIQIP